eukprot:CAMPEP_0178602544 /NCGR_PEP_ID=MMETSP0697-20121206/35024_1 /TAXON_ID=265572 /ORGANISM="Extubocellulus spinifer, Strain CCMP396" /LENGTH=124 /DNA_ID=CAMNT_0020240769 /DNA_START=394 /DNA_END=768 /DNA_ORIENTATION=-
MHALWKKCPHILILAGVSCLEHNGSKQMMHSPSPSATSASSYAHSGASNTYGATNSISAKGGDCPSRCPAPANVPTPGIPNGIPNEAPPPPGGAKGIGIGRGIGAKGPGITVAAALGRDIGMPV